MGRESLAMGNASISKRLKVHLPGKKQKKETSVGRLRREERHQFPASKKRFSKNAVLLRKTGKQRAKRILPHQKNPHPPKKTKPPTTTKNKKTQHKRNTRAAGVRNYYKGVREAEEGNFEPSFQKRAEWASALNKDSEKIPFSTGFDWIPRGAKHGKVGGKKKTAYLE